MYEEAAPHLLRGTQDQRLRKVPSTGYGGPPRAPSRYHQAKETGMVWPYHTTQQSLQDHHARDGGGGPQAGTTTKELVRQHQGVDRHDHGRPPSAGGGQTTVEEDLGLFSPQIPPTTKAVKGHVRCEM